MKIPVENLEATVKFHYDKNRLVILAAPPTARPDQSEIVSNPETIKAMGFTVR